MNHRKTSQIGCTFFFGMMLAGSVQADVSKLCQKLNQKASVDKELDVCAVKPNEAQKSTQTDAAFKSGTGNSTSYVYEDRAAMAFSSHPVGDFSDQTLLGNEDVDIRAMAFDANGSVLYAIENLNKT